jgi:predicted transposase YbfD/YdcC
MLFLQWMLYTAKKTLHKIVEKGNHYLVKVKGNQPKLKAAIEETIILNEATAYHLEEKISRGRLEIRETHLFTRENNIAEGWESIQTIVFVRRNFLSKKKEHKTDSLYVTDLKTIDAEFIAKGVRSHWHTVAERSRSIENRLHYTKDVVMQEDAKCTKNNQAAPNLALFRDFAFNILKTENKSIKQATEVFANYNVKELLKILFRT